MVQMLIRFGKWLEARFPEKIVITVKHYEDLLARIANLEANSVHKDAVKILVLELKKVQDEFATVRTGLGLNTPKAAEIQAMLNGQPIGEPNE